MEHEDWNREATKVLKAELKRSGVSYEELVKKLAGLGTTASYKGIANKVNRGTFTFAFFMQCMKALGKATVRLDD
jgi:hypothetical protein